MNQFAQKWPGRDDVSTQDRPADAEADAASHDSRRSKEGTNLPILGDLVCCSQTSYPYDACSPCAATGCFAYRFLVLETPRQPRPRPSRSTDDGSGVRSPAPP